MSETLIATKGLQERITARIHEGIGDLVTEADLRVIVERGVEEFFFKPRVVEDTGWHGRKTIPPLIQEIVDAVLKEQMRRAIDQWMKDNKETIKQAVEAAIKRGIAGVLADVLDERFTSLFNSVIYNMQNQGMLPKGPASP